MNPTRKGPPNVAERRSFDWLAAGAVAICLCHFLSSMVPSVWTWGIDYWSEFPLWGRSLLLLLIALVILPGVPEKIAEALGRKSRPRAAAWVGLVVAFAIFLIFRSRGFAYGDGYTILSYIADGELPDLSGNLALMAGDLAAHWLVFRAIVMPLDGSVGVAYAVLSALAGVASLVAIAQIARGIYPKDRGARWTVTASACTSGMAVLWFGHVEAYSLVGAGLLWSLAFVLMGKKWWAWGAWILSCAFHLLAVAFLPVLVSAMWGQRVSASLTRAKAVILFLVGFFGWGLAALAFSFMKPGIFVPILPTADSNYTALSMAHLADTLNLLLFAAPLGLVGILVWFPGREPKESKDTDISVSILAVAAGSLWYFSFWVDPLIGAFRDWDLIGIYGIPFSILGAILILGRRLAPSERRPQWVIVAVLALVHTGAFVATTQNETDVIKRVDRLVREDAHYTREFYQGARLMSWAHTLTHVVDEKELAIEHLRKRSIWQPRDRKSWNNLGSLYWHLEQYDSAAVSLEKSLDLMPNDPVILEELALVYAQLEQWDTAGGVIETLAGLRELKVNELNILSYSLISKNELARAESLLTVSLQRAPEQQAAHFYLGILSENRDDTSRAIAEYELAMAPRGELEDAYLRCSRLYQARMQWADAERVALAWQSQFPGSAMAAFIVGSCRIASRQYAGAREALERAAVLDPRSAFVHFYLATAYRNLNEPEKARAAALRSAQIDPTLALPYLELVYLAADVNDRQAAVAATREYLRRSPGDSAMDYLQQFMEP